MEGNGGRAGVEPLKYIHVVLRIRIKQLEVNNAAICFKPPNTNVLSLSKRQHCSCDITLSL